MDNPTTTNDKMASNNENETVQIEEDCNGGDLDKTDLDDMNFNNTNLEITDSDNTEDRSNVENKVKLHDHYSRGNALAGVIGSDVPWLDYPACNAITWVITVTE